MTININEVVSRIKKVGQNNVRIVAMRGQPALDGLHQIEINENGSWVTLVNGVTAQMAEDIVRQASNRVILG